MLNLLCLHRISVKNSFKITIFVVWFVICFLVKLILIDYKDTIIQSKSNYIFNFQDKLIDRYFSQLLNTIL